VSRQHAASRKISNYAALHDRVLAAHGIVPVMLENMQIEQQVDLFAKADLVIAEHGAGLANVAFMRPGATLIELLPRPIAHRAVYRYVAAHRHLNYIYATLPVPEGWRWDKDDLFAPLDLYDFLLSEESAMPRQHIAAA
jgi:capsular polysaccharide biosynthesis protein